MPERYLLEEIFQPQYLEARKEQVRHHIDRLVATNCLLTAYPEEGASSHSTAILGINKDSDELLLDAFREAGRQRPPRACSYRIVGRNSGLRIGLEGMVSGTGELGGAAVYRFQFGWRLWIMQRRGSFRADIPPTETVICSIATDDGRHIQARAVDLGLGGIGTLVQIGAKASCLAPAVGTHLATISFTLPGGHSVSCSGVVANLRRGERNKPSLGVMGIRFDPLTQEQERTISRFIHQREREKRRRERGY